MPVDTTEKRINIKDLTVEEPAPGNPFDLGREITEEDFAMIEERINKEKQSNGYYELLNNYKIIRPDLGIQMEEPDWDSFNLSGSDLREWGSRFMLRANIFYLTPTTETKRRLGVDDKYKTATLEKLRKATLGFPAEQPLVWAIANLFPNEINPERYSELKSYLTQEIDKSLENGTYDSFATFAADFRVAFPSEKFSYKMTPQMWAALIEDLGVFRRTGAASNFARLASRMKILTVNKVQQTNSGVKLVTFPPKHEEEFIGVPEVRRF